MNKTRFTSTRIESNKPLNGKDFNKALSKKNNVIRDRNLIT